jgi:lactate permease
MPGEFSVLYALSALLIGALWLKRLWFGALMALVLFSATMVLRGSDVLSFVSAAADGAVISFELVLLLFGAYFFFRSLQANNHFDSLNTVTATFSSRISVVIILCYYFGSVMEGVAGFGIPAMLIAPMLLSMGFRSLTCAVLPLAANTTAVTFGALGTPLKVGLGIFSPDETVQFSLILNFIPATFLPFMLAFLYERTEQVEVAWRKDWRMLLYSGLIFSVLYAGMGMLSVEYASVVSGALGLLIYVFLFVPKHENASMWLWVRTFYPYFLFIGLLLGGRFFLSGMSVGLGGLSRPLPLYQPGVLFVVAGLVYAMFFQDRGLQSFSFARQLSSTARAISKPALTILLLVCFTQLIRADLTAIARSYLQGCDDSMMLTVSPLLGIAGSFLTGSATMSNLLFGSVIQWSDMSVENMFLMMALLHTGSAIGNAVSLQNILMVQSVVDDSGTGYSSVLKWNSIVVICYLIPVVLVALILLNP